MNNQQEYHTPEQEAWIVKQAAIIEARNAESVVDKPERTVFNYMVDYKHTIIKQVIISAESQEQAEAIFRAAVDPRTPEAQELLKNRISIPNLNHGSSIGEVDEYEATSFVEFDESWYGDE